MSFPTLSFSGLLASGVLGVALAPAAAGCAADATAGAGDGDGASEAALNASELEPGSFKLYGEPRATPNPSCDVHTALMLTRQGGARAMLHEAVLGLCEIDVDPDPREYRLRLDGTSCGSMIYNGEQRSAGRTREIKITDHRTRLCRDLVPAKIIVEETDASGATRTRYSYDEPPVSGGISGPRPARSPTSSAARASSSTRSASLALPSVLHRILLPARRHAHAHA